MKSESQKLVPKTDGTAVPQAPPGSPCKNEPLKLAEGSPAALGKDTGVSAPPAATGLPAGSDACSAETDDCPSLPKLGALPEEEPDSSPTAQEEPTAGLGQQGAPLEMDSSVFLDDDSSQPMPVSRFFGNVELMQVRRGTSLPRHSPGVRWPSGASGKGRPG